MNSAEKPYENLVSTEKEIFQICGEVILWDPGQERSPELLDLRQRATALFEEMRKRDITTDDSYYKHLAEAQALKKELEQLKHNFGKAKYIESDFIKTTEDFDVLAQKLLATVNSHTPVDTVLDWVEPDQENPYTDYTIIRLTPEGENNFELNANELFNQFDFESQPHVKAFYEALSEEIKKEARFKEHTHNGGDGVKEYSISIEGQTKEKLKILLEQFIEIIKANPRMAKENL